METAIDLKEELRHHPFVEGFGEEHIAKLASMAQPVRFEPDQVIFKEGDDANWFYLLLSGRVALEIKAHGRVLCMQTVGEGDELGWSSLVAAVRKQFQARAVEPVHALSFDGDALLHACEQQCAFGYVMLRSTLRVVADRLQNTLLQLLDVYRPGKKVQ